VARAVKDKVLLNQAVVVHSSSRQHAMCHQHLLLPHLLLLQLQLLPLLLQLDLSTSQHSLLLCQPSNRR
jgi:hypothetical protein